jgi:hypothetical protein
MTSDNSLSLILRRLDEIERKLDRMLEEPRMPTAIGYSVRRGNLPRKDRRKELAPGYAAALVGPCSDEQIFGADGQVSGPGPSD